MRGSLAAVKAEQSSLYWTMSSLWAFQNWESCPRSRSVFRSERCRVRVTLGERGPRHWGCPFGYGAGCGLLMPCSPQIHPEHPSAIRTQVPSHFPASPVAEGEWSTVNSRWRLLLRLLGLPPNPAHPLQPCWGSPWGWRCPQRASGACTRWVSPTCEPLPHSLMVLKPLCEHPSTLGSPLTSSSHCPGRGRAQRGRRGASWRRRWPQRGSAGAGCAAAWLLYQQVHPRPAVSAITPLSMSTPGFCFRNESLGTFRSRQSECAGHQFVLEGEGLAAARGAVGHPG